MKLLQELTDFRESVVSPLGTSVEHIETGANIRVSQIKSLLKILLKFGVKGLCAFAGLLFFSACTTPPTEGSLQTAACKNIDWYEAGRSDGALGLPMSRLEQYQNRCDSTVNVEQYTVGRDAGLVEYCSPTFGMEAGRNALTYYHVCPENLEQVFISNYDLGQRIRRLERTNVDLEERIRNLQRLTSQNQTNDSLYNQIRQLRSLRAKNESDITDLESQDPQTGF